MTNPAGEQVEGNVTEIDLPARYFILEDRQAKPFLKVFWAAAQEGPADNPTYLFKKIRKLQPGYYTTPVVTLEEKTGGLQEGIMVDLPYKERPADFPKVKKKGGTGGNYQPRNERAIILECCLKVAADVWIAGSDKTLKYEEVMIKITTEAIKTAKELCKEAGVS